MHKPSDHRDLTVTPPVSSSLDSKVDRLSVGALVLLLWLWAWLPQMIDLIEIGRQHPEFGATAQRSDLAGSAYYAIVGSMVVVAIFLIGKALTSGARVPTFPLALLMAPWIALNASYVAHGGRNNEVLIFPLMLVAFALHSNYLPATYSLLRRLLMISVVLSLALGLARPDLFLSDPTNQIGNEKALVGDLLLNGLFPTSNQLGITIAIGIPLLVLAGAGRTKWPLVGASIVALVWTSSRTSLAATAVVLLVLALCARRKTSSARKFATLTIVAAFAATVAAPFYFNDPSGFSGRVAIWKASFTFISNGPLFQGGGAMVFRDVSPVTSSIGSNTGTGHNVFVTVLTVGGVIALVAVGALLIAYLLRAREVFERDRFPMTFLLTICSLAILEDPLRAFIVAPSAFLVAPLLAMPLARAGLRDSSGTQTTSDPQARLILDPRGERRRTPRPVASG